MRFAIVVARAALGAILELQASRSIQPVHIGYVVWTAIRTVDEPFVKIDVRIEILIVNVDMEEACFYVLAEKHIQIWVDGEHQLRRNCFILVDGHPNLARLGRPVVFGQDRDCLVGE